MSPVLHDDKCILNITTTVCLCIQIWGSTGSVIDGYYNNIISVLKHDYRLLINGKQTFVPDIYKMLHKCEAPIKHAIYRLLLLLLLLLLRCNRCDTGQISGVGTGSMTKTILTYSARQPVVPVLFQSEGRMVQKKRKRLFPWQCIHRKNRMRS